MAASGTVIVHINDWWYDDKPRVDTLASVTYGHHICGYCKRSKVKGGKDEGWTFCNRRPRSLLMACPLHRANLEVEMAYGD